MSDAPQKKTRRQMLEEFVAGKPNDAFARYGLALECMNSGDPAAAEDHFRKLLEVNPDYVPGYQMFGQLILQASRAEEATQVIRSGIAAAIAKGDQHARSELEAMLEQLN